LNELLFSEDTKKIVAKRLNISVALVEKSLNYFKEAGIVVNNSLRKSLTNYPKNDKFKISVEFEVV